MIEEEYNRLLELLEKSIKGQEVTLEEILKEAVVFFETLRKEFISAEKEKKEEMIQMMNNLHGKLQQVSKQAAESTGMSEEELAAFAENPSNFTPEQWQIIQGSKRQLYDTARDFSSSTEGEKKGEKKKKSPPQRTRRTKRSDWIKP